MKLAKITLVLVTIFMIGITILGFFPSLYRFIFAGGSDSLMDMTKSSSIIQIVLIMTFGFLIKLYFSKKDAKILVLLILVIGLWCLSSRNISKFPNGRISSGWFYLETDRTQLCDNTSDCEKIMYYQTQVEPISFWRLHIKSVNTDKKLFVGPFVWNSSQKVLNFGDLN